MIYLYRDTRAKGVTYMSSRDQAYLYLMNGSNYASKLQRDFIYCVKLSMKIVLVCLVCIYLLTIIITLTFYYHIRTVFQAPYHLLTLFMILNVRLCYLFYYFCRLQIPLNLLTD